MKFLRESKYYLAALVAYSIWGVFSLVLRPLHQYPALDILFYRVFTCALLMLIISFVVRRKVWKENKAIFLALPARRKKEIIWLNLGGGLFLTGNWFSYIYVMNHNTVKATSLAYLVCPILTTLLAFIIHREKLSRWQWAAVLLSVTGCILISFNHLEDILYSLIIAIFYAFYLVYQRGNTGFDKLLLLTFQFLFSALLILPFYPSFSAPMPTASTFYVYIGVIAVGFTIFPLFLNLFALKGINSSTAGMLLNINPLIAFMLAIFHFHEEIDLQQVIAYGLILVAVILFNQHLIFGKKEKDAMPVSDVSRMGVE